MPQLWEKWMIDGVPSLPPAGLRRAPTKEMLARWLMDAWHDGTEDDIMFDYVCPAHAAPVGSNDDDAETSGDEDRDSSRTL